MSLNTRTEPMEDRRISLIVEVDQERVDQELRKAARTVGRQYRIPGFRKGKAPYNMVVQYVGLPNLYSEFVDSLGNEIYAAAVEQEEIQPYAMASLDVSTLEPLTYNFEIPLEPTVELGDYRSLRLEEEEPEVTDEEVEEVFRELQSQHVGWTEVERPSEYGDMLTIDVKSVLVREDDAAEEAATDSTDDDGEDTDDETVVLDETDWDVMLDEENPMEPPGLDQELLGVSAGEEKDFVLSWPEDGQSMYAGKKADFHVKLHSIKANLEPELDDEFAKKVNEDFDTVDDLKADVVDNILQTKRTRAESDYLESVLDALVEQSEMDYPPVVVEDQIDSMVSEFARQLQTYGIESLEAYLDQVGQSMEEYRDSLREQAEIAAKRNLVISEVYQHEGISVTDEELEERIEAMKENFGGDEATDEQLEMANMLAENMRSGTGRNILESQIIQEKSLQRLVAIARGEEVPEPAAPEPEADADSQDDGAGGEDSEKESDVATMEATESPSAAAPEVAGAEDGTAEDTDADVVSDDGSDENEDEDTAKQ